MNNSQHNSQKDKRTPAPKQQCKSHACVSPTGNRDSVQLPKLKSGKGYNKIEIVNIMLKVPCDNRNLQHATIQAIVDHQMQHNTPCCSRTFYCLLEKHAHGGITSLESARGRVGHKSAVTTI
jgi:hypothetical protein